MTVALVTDGIWPYVLGGMQKHSYFLCKYLLKNGVRVVLIHTADVITDEVRNASCFSGEERELLTSVVIEKPVVARFPGHYIYQSWLYSREVDKKLQGLGPIDFIIAKGLAAWYTLRHKTRECPPIGVNIHGYEFMQRTTGIKMWFDTLQLGFPLRAVNRRADYVFSYGGKITGYIKKLGIPQERIIEIPAAIEEEWMNDANRDVSPRRRFVFVGRYERRKGIEELSSVLKTLLEKEDFTFSFVGPIPVQEQIQHPNVSYHGVVSDKAKIQEILGKSDVLVCPSYAEGMPNVIIEGMANGCAAIATDVGAVSLLVNDQNGWLIEPGNTDALYQAMKGAIDSSSEEMTKKKIAAYRHIRENFLWTRVAGIVVDAIKKRVKN